MRSSSTVGIDGHQWNLHLAAGARLPCRAICECGWTSTAGQRTQVLLDLKGHLEEALSKRCEAQQRRHGYVNPSGAPSSLAGRPGAHNQGSDRDDL